MDDVMGSPFFGINPETWTRPDWMIASVDNYWLLVMLRSGIPSLLFIFLCILLIWRALTRRTGPALFTNLRTGWG